MTTSYYRLRRVVLEVPPLRDRREDIPLLVEHIRRRANARYALAVDGVTAPAAERLLAHPWPGNVRELEAVVEEAMILKGQGWLEPSDLPLDSVRAAPRPPRISPHPSTLRPAMRCLRTALEMAAARGECRGASSSPSPACPASSPDGLWPIWPGSGICGGSGAGGARGTWWRERSCMLPDTDGRPCR